MKFLKFRHIFTLAIVLVVGITLMVYFLGGLNATALDSSNLEFTHEGYLDYSEYDSEGNRWVIYEDEESMLETVEGLDEDSYETIIEEVDEENSLYIVQYKLRSDRIVAQNDTYTMFLDELTTIVTVGVNSTAAEPVGKTVDGFDNYDLSTFETTFETALANENLGRDKSNFLLYYVGSNDRETASPFTTWDNSVSYNDLLLGERQRHYKIKFDIENGIEILYNVGNFTVIDSFFPHNIDREEFFGFFRGNLTFLIDSSAVNQDRLLKYVGAYTWSKECADYIEENDLGTVKPNYGSTTLYDEEGNPIVQRYDITDVLETDEEGNQLNVLKMKQGIHYNPANVNAEGASPCEVNPFANYYTLDNLFRNIYGLISVDLEDENITYPTNWVYEHPNLSPTFRWSGSNSFINNSKLYEFMYKRDLDGDRNFFYEQSGQVTISADNYLDYVGQFPSINIGDRIRVKEPVSYIEDLSKLVNGYFNSITNSFYSNSAMTSESLMTPDSDKIYMDENTYNTYIWNEDRNQYEYIDKTMSIGGRQARDEEGNFLYDEDGMPVQEVYTLERADIQNSIYGNVVEVNPPIFQVAMRFTLTDEGLETTILNNSIEEGRGANYRDENGSKTQFSHDLRISRIEVLPRLTVNGDADSEGQIILPDGSGAVMSFNSPKAHLGYRSPIKRIYGADMAFTHDESQETEENQNLMFGMYGFLDKTERKGVLAIVDKGASQTSIRAEYKRDANTRNQAYFISQIRERENVHIGTTRRTTFTKWSNERSQTDLNYIYQFMLPNEFVDNDGSIQYVSLANKYREYLEKKYDLYPKDQTDDNVLALTFLGSIDKRVVSFGFASNEEVPLTTFSQAQDIIEELSAEGGLEFAVAYKGWTRDAMEPKATNNPRVSKVLGNAKGLKEFEGYLSERDINLYPEINVASNKGYDYSFGNMKYTAKSVGGTYAQHREFDLATRRSNQTIEPITVISPVFYVDYINRFFKSYNKFNVAGGLFTDLGSIKSGDYSRTRVTYPEIGLMQQQAAFDVASQNLDSVMVSAPYDYALAYVDFAVDVPLESTLLGHYDYSIPFYQLVVAGLFDYAGPAVNFDSEKNANWYLLKALETGSNLQFLLSAEDTNILLDTDYTMYQGTYYANWKNEIIRMNNIINDVGIHNLGNLRSHKVLRDNVYKVGYSNGVELIINFTNSTYYDYTGLSVKPNWFLVTQEGR